MSKRILLFVLLFFLFIACKKEKKAPVIYSVIGNWALYSYQTNFGIGVNATIAQYPCMGYNISTFYQDSTLSQNYSGIDTCFITAHVKGAQYYGLPGASPLPAKWSQKGNILRVTYPGNNQSVPGVVSSVNGQLQITFRDTIISGPSTYYITTVEVKQ